MRKCKTKSVQADLGIFTHIQTYSELCVTLAYSESEAYSEPWYIQNPDIFRTLVYSKPCQTSTMERFAKIVEGYHYSRNINFSLSLLYEKNMIFLNTGLIFTLELSI